MTTTYTPIKYNTANQRVYCSVFSQSTGQFQAAPTIAAGDFQRSIDGGAFQNMDNIPVVTPAAGRVIAITLSAAETTCDRLTIIGNDAAGAEWDDVFINCEVTHTPLEDIAAAVWEVATAGLVTIGSIGRLLVGNINATIGGIPAAVDVVLTAAHSAGSWAGATTAAIDAVLTAAHGAGAWTGATAATIWSYATRTLTQTTASVIATISGSDMTITRGDTLTATLTGLASDVSDNDKIWFTYKRNKTDADTAALVMIDKATGLVYINGAVATTAANGSITTPTATSAVITLAAAETAKLIIESGFYDVQKLKGTTVSTLTSGNLSVSADVTLATS